MKFVVGSSLVTFLLIAGNGIDAAFAAGQQGSNRAAQQQVGTLDFLEIQILLQDFL